MNIKKVINFVPNFNFGGVENSNINLTHELRNLGFDAELLTNNIIDSKFAVDENTEIRSLNRSKMLFSVFALINYINLKKPDLIICSQFYANIIIIICCFLSRYKNKLVICERVPVYENLKNISYFKRQILKFLIKKLYPKAHCVVVNSKGTKIELNKLVTNIKTKVIYNPVLNEQIDVLSHEEIEDFNFQSNYIYLTTVSRISYEKNIEEMVEIISKINCNTNFKLLIIGDGPRLDCVKQTVSKLNLDEKIIFLGFKSNPYKYLKYCDMYLSTSKFEGMGNSLVEALHFGLNIVSYDSPGGISEILGHGKYGHLIEHRNTDDFVRFLNSNICKKNIRKNKSLNNHLQMFYSDVFIENFVKLMNEISDE